MFSRVVPLAIFRALTKPSTIVFKENQIGNNSSIYWATKGEGSMELSIQERLKDLRVERGLTLEQLAEQTHLSKFARQL